jgi:hypothetical protein
MFMLDTSGVTRLIWAALAGHAGTWPRVVAFGILLPLSCMIAVTLYRPTRSSQAKVRKKAARASRPSNVEGERVGTRDGGLGDRTPVTKRRSRPGSRVVVD